MSKNKKKKDSRQIDFWQSATDIALGLIMILLLVIALLVLYLFKMPEKDRLFLWGTEENIQQEGNDFEYAGNSKDPYMGEAESEPEETHDDGGSGDGGETEDEYHERYPLPSSGGDDPGKAAVYVTVIDEETKKAIREPGVTFELYQIFGGYQDIDDDKVPDAGSYKGAIRFLNTYYPKKIEYRKYATTDKGTFYLPEKVEQDAYYFVELTEPAGYDASENIAFVLDDSYDWNDPYVVSVPLSPSKNVIRVQLMDLETKELIDDGEFTVTANTAISTKDGTIRYVENELADTIRLEKDGTGISKGLYLGEYSVKQSRAPLYYTTADDAQVVSVEKKNGIEPEAHVFYCERTKYDVILTDDQSGAKLPGAVFELYDKDNKLVRSSETDANGMITFSELEKNMTYAIRQVSAPDQYHMDKETYQFYVDSTGHIGDTAHDKLALTNYIPRVEVAVSDRLLGGPVADQAMSIFDSNDNLIMSWTSGGTPQSITGLTEGEYYITKGNNAERFTFTVDNAEEINHVQIQTWSVRSILTVAAAVILIPLVLFILITCITKILKRRKTK